MAPKPILLADDDANLAFLAVRAFKDAGAANPIVTVPDGAAAIEYLERNAPPCLLMLDHHLPGKSGLEVLEWVRAQAKVCTLPVLLFSSSTYEGDARAAYLLGANGVLVKPATLDEMRAMAGAIKDYWLTFNRSA
jgi:CheY-like chemotaxis protein